MAALSTVVRARSLLNSFTDIEFDQLSSHFVKQCGRDSLLKPFFDQFMKQKESANNQPLNAMMNIINIIMRKRKQNSNANASIKPNIKTIPKAIIGEVASYLSQTDYASLSTTNRSIYIGCNDPKTLKHLDLLKINNYSCMNLSHYPQLIHLELKLTKFNQLSLLKDPSILNDLNKLTLDADTQKNVDLIPLISQTAIDLNNITHLRLRGFGKANLNDSFSKDTFFKLLSKFPNVKQFDMGEVIPSIVSPEELQEIKLTSILPNVTEIRSYRSNLLLQNHVLTSYASSLQSVNMVDHPNVIIPSLPKLEELIIFQSLYKYGPCNRNSCHAH